MCRACSVGWESSLLKLSLDDTVLPPEGASELTSTTFFNVLCFSVTKELHFKGFHRDEIQIKMVRSPMKNVSLPHLERSNLSDIEVQYDCLQSIVAGLFSYS